MIQQWCENNKFQIPSKEAPTDVNVPCVEEDKMIPLVLVKNSLDEMYPSIVSSGMDGTINGVLQLDSGAWLLQLTSLALDLPRLQNIRIYHCFNRQICGINFMR